MDIPNADISITTTTRQTSRSVSSGSKARSACCSRWWEEDTYCIDDVLTQVGSATKALQLVALELLGDHLSHCVHDAVTEGGAEADIKIHEAQAAIERLARS